MTNEEYLYAQHHILVVAGMVAEMPLRDFIADAERADTVGPFLDPTLWQAGHENLAVILDIARGLRNFQDIVLTKRQLVKG